MNAETKQCQNCKQNFTVESEDFDFYKKIDVPTPVECPQCRQKNRIIFRNFKTLYKRNSSRSGKPVISMYSSKISFPVWTHDEWWADDWDAKNYGKDFDFTRPFFEQLKELLSTVPRFAVMNVSSSNCEYSNFVAGSKNCYLVFGCVDDEDCAYGHIVWESKDCVDDLYVYKYELCYECVDCLGCYKTFYSRECENCSESIGLYDCKSCSNCIGCVGLKQKSYHIFNKHIGKEEYEKFLKEHPLSDKNTISFIDNELEKLRKEIPQRHFFGSHNSDVSGNHIYSSKNIHHGFDVKNSEDSKFLFTSRKMIGVYDQSFGVDVENGYQIATASMGSSNIFFSHISTGSHYLYYCDSCFNSRDLFGCVGMKSGEYCILNKQYTKEEYEQLLPKIIEYMKKTGEWGQFFPKELSFFGYNESIINEYYPLTKEQALAQGYSWIDDLPFTSGQENIEYQSLPQNPADYSNDLLKHILKCRNCGRNYRFIEKEIQFHKQMNILLPQECPNCRHARRMGLRNPRFLWDGNCSNCGTIFKTSYPPDKQKEYKIHCEKCYLEKMG